ncbi:MAG TPA: PGPGW domain-containing protein [Myxococcaceae bacterium]|nr:PGPGW domain-containing protein [Myxococcaceae bacterium]
MGTNAAQPLQDPPPEVRAASGWLRRARMVGVTLVGGTAVLLGIVMLVLPGPGLLVILAGLALLATEYAWARWLIHRARGRVARLRALLERARPRREMSARP